MRASPAVEAAATTSAPARLPVTAIALVLGATLVQALVVDRYGWFRDELYYVACGRRLAWGYVDHPPLVAFLARAGEWLGGSLAALRGQAILAGAGTMLVTALLARRFGGGGLAATLAAFALFASPFHGFAFHYFSMNAFELLLAAAFVLLATEAVVRPSAGRWIAVGAVVGVGLLAKYGIAFWAAAAFGAIALSPHRRVLATRGPWLAVLVAAAIAAPHLAWQVANGFPTLEFIANAQRTKIADLSPLAFVAAQLSLLGPANALLWLPGLWLLLRGRIGGGDAPTPATVSRLWGVAWLLLLGLYLLQRAKPYYLAASYPVLLAAGAVAWERWLATRPRLRWLGVPYAALGLAIVPMGIPVLPVEALVPYAGALAGATPKDEKGRLAELPQHFADMFGWPELVATIRGVAAALPPGERGTAVVLAGNYGQAAALEVLGGSAVPPVTSPHNAFWTWGPVPGDPVIAVGVPEDGLRRAFAEVREVARTRCSLCRPTENDVPVFVARRRLRPLDEAWREARVFR